MENRMKSIAQSLKNMLLQRLRNGVSCLTSLKQTSLGSDIRKILPC